MTDLSELHNQLSTLLRDSNNKLINTREILKLLDAFMKEIEMDRAARSKMIEDYLEELSRTYQEISTLFELNNLFSSVVDPKEKLSEMSELLFQTISFGGITVTLKLPEENVCFEQRIDVSEEIFDYGRQLTSKLNDEVLLLEPSDRDPVISNLLSVPIKGMKSIWGRITLIEKKSGIFTAVDRKILESTAQQLAAVCERNLRLKQEIERERLKRELEIARQIQRRLLPSSSPNIFFAELSAYSEPAIQVGGDYYDFVTRGNKFMFCIADVSGKGVPAALLMTSLRSALRTLASSQASISELAMKLNNIMCEDLEEDRFVTMALCCLSSSGEIEIVNAGHNPVLLSHAGKVEVLVAQDLPLGVVPDFEYHAHKIRLDPGDTILLYTDGVIEARNESNEEYGLDRLIQVFNSVTNSSVEKIADTIYEELRKFVQNEPQHDDTTIAVVKYLGEKS